MREPPIIQRVDVVAQSRLFKVETVRLQFSNGAARTFERLSSQGRSAVMVVPIDGDELIMVREYAVGREAYELGFIKGLIDPGESAEQAANRELQEEIGLRSNQLEFVRSLTATPHYSCAKSDLFIARDLLASQLQGDEPEPLEKVRWPLTNLPDLLSHPDITDARTLFSIAYLTTLLPKL